MRTRLSVSVPLPAHTNAALWMGLNMAPPNMSHMGPIIMIADTMTVTVSANSPRPLMDARASAACSSSSSSSQVCRMHHRRMHTDKLDVA